MPSLEVVKQYLATTLLPLVAGLAANWLFVHLSWFAQIGVSAGSIEGIITQLGVVGLTAVFAWLGAHHILSGHYAAPAKAAAAARKKLP